MKFEMAEIGSSSMETMSESSFSTKEIFLGRNVNLIVVPMFDREEMSIVPPNQLMIFLLMFRPSPQP